MVVGVHFFHPIAIEKQLSTQITLQDRANGTSHYQLHGTIRIQTTIKPRGTISVHPYPTNNYYFLTIINFPHVHT